MKLYRFSPINRQEEFLECITYLHKVCHELCFQTFNRYLPVSGNIGIFSHYNQEYEFLLKLRDKLVDPRINYKQKYFRLIKPITIEPRAGIPGAMYTLLYIRQPDPYRAQVGDIDFVLDLSEHEAFKQTLEFDKFRNGARLFHRPEDNMIELCNPDIDAAAYIVNKPMVPDSGPK
jgi:hypothetical protein